MGKSNEHHLLVGGLEHQFYFSISYMGYSSQLTMCFFFRGVETTNQDIIYRKYDQFIMGIGRQSV